MPARTRSTTSRLARRADPRARRAPRGADRTHGAVGAGLLSDLDPPRAGRDQLPFLRESSEVVNARTTNWTAVPCPTPAWASLVYPGPRGRAALEACGSRSAHLPPRRARSGGGLGARQDALVGVSERLTERGFDALHFEGPGTDLRVGLLPTSRWLSARF